MKLLDKLKWRYVTKSFDKSRKREPEQLNKLLQIANLAPSSYGLQPLSLIVDENAEFDKILGLPQGDSPRLFWLRLVTAQLCCFVFHKEIHSDGGKLFSGIENAAIFL